ncbi:MAG: 5'-methylthioadenosine/adenosylhomocysteine nucleosidase [Elusimicrobia bacterium]|nr:5'-methylthioadenosine/adenosylhomocysteine nucleosidase [Elusimicrobiota bacterium]
MTKVVRGLLLVFLSGTVLPAVLSSSPGNSPPEPTVTGILGAFAEETRVLKVATADKDVRTISGIEFVSGKLEGRRVVIAGTGVGKVNAAVVAALLLAHFHPNEVIFTGIAGAVDKALRPGDIVIGEKLAQHDLGHVGPRGFRAESVENPIDRRRNPLFFPSDPALVGLARRAASELVLEEVDAKVGRRTPKVLTGIIVTGDVFVASRRTKAFLKKEFDADAVEMEGAAVAQVCFQQKVPFLVLRSMSDSADENAGLDIGRFYQKAAANSAALTRSLLRQLAKRDGAQTMERLEGQ